jgi:hypothetical protein
MADITPIVDDGGYFYVSKYLAKDVHGFPTDVRRVGTSQGIKLDDREPSEDYWTVFISNPLDKQ